MKTVSIIIPVYNAEKYLAEAIESCIAQTYKDIEIIAVIHDCVDSSHEILRNYLDHINIVTQNNISAISAVNIGIRKMKGEWFKLMATDDVLYPNAIQELISATQKFSDKKNCVFYSHYEEIDSEGKFIKNTLEPDYSRLDIFDRNVGMLDEVFPNIITSLIHKDVFENYGLFDENVDFAADYEFWLRLGLQYKCNFHLVPKILVKYRRHEKQTSRNEIKIYPNEADNIKKLILGRLDLIEQQKYEIAIRQYNKMKKPLLVKCRHALRDVMFKVLPQPVSKKIVDSYLSHKKEIH